MQTLDRFPGGARSLGLVTCFGMAGPGPWWVKPSMGKPASVRSGLSDATLIMMIMRVLVEELLCQGMTGCYPVLEFLFVRCVWVPAATSYHARP
jgi:hypothetical protein